VDPISDQFPHLSTYSYASNDPIVNIDLWGLQGVNVNFGCDGCPSIGEIWNQITTSVSDFFNSIGADDIVEEGNSYSTAVSTSKKIESQLEDFSDNTIELVPGVSTIKAIAGGNESTSEVGLDLAGIFLPGLKFAKPATKGASATVKFSDEVVDFIQGTGDKAKKITASIPEGFSKVNAKGFKGKVFSDGNTFISPDLDGHIGGIWKAAKSIKALGRKDTRLGTFNSNLQKIGD